ncbi:hypothetical protein CsSME_00010118 [Camellia sinensis var. sinensis]
MQKQNADFVWTSLEVGEDIGKAVKESPELIQPLYSRDTFYLNLSATLALYFVQGEEF